MIFLRNLFWVLFGAIFIYTVFVVQKHGVDFISAFIEDVLAVAWRGQMAVDFAFYLLLSGVWIIWRYGFTPMAFLLGVIVGVGGMLLFAPYMLYAIFRAKGDMKVLLFGKARALTL